MYLILLIITLNPEAKGLQGLGCVHERFVYGKYLIKIEKKNL